MPRDTDPVAETSGSGSRRMGTASATRADPWAGCRISDLPRDVLLRVLSCLEVLQVVRTCVLSRLWRDLWRDVPSINASLLEFGADADGDYEQHNPRFQNFVNRLLMLRNPVTLDRFRLWPYIGQEMEADTAEANLWIGHALLCNARFVEVFVLAGGFRLEMDPAVFTSQHLKGLRLTACRLTPGLFGRLQQGCGVLQYLVLLSCRIQDTEISSHTLKILYIMNSFFDDQASISIPSLVYLVFFGCSHERIPLLANMESLEKAYISVGRIEYPGIQVDDVSQFLQGLSRVKALEFYFVQTELNMERNLQWCPRFNCLKFPTVGEWCLHADFYALTVLLQNSPNLERLTLNLKKATGSLTGELRERSFRCDQLEIVEIICLERSPVANRLKEFLTRSGITSSKIRIKH